MINDDLMKRIGVLLNELYENCNYKSLKNAKKKVSEKNM